MDDSATRTTLRLVLEPHPSSAAAARRWVREGLHEHGHDELSESAELATSELVTNAILHAQTTITVMLEGLADRWRVIVRDLSPEAPARAVQQAGQQIGQVWTSGRGLQILSVITRRWGVDDAPPGKQVWFEPRPITERVERDDDAEVGDGAPRGQRRSGREIVLRQPPVALLRQARQRISDLHRELVLLGFDSGDDVPERLVELAAQVAPVADALLGDGQEPAEGVDWILRVPSVEEAAPMGAWADLFDEADDFSREGHLLTLAAPRSEALARRWLLGELARQTSGLAPRSWPDFAP